MVDYRVEDHQVALMRSSSSMRKSMSKVTGIRGGKKIALKQRMAELETRLSNKTKALEATKGQIVELSNKVETLRDEVETTKVEHAAHIDDVMEKMMQEQAARAEFRKASEARMVDIENKTEEIIITMTTETDAALEAIKDDWSERVRFTKDLHAHEKMLVEREMNVTLEDRNDLVSFYEKECRALKKLTKAARKALKKKLSGGFFFKPKKAIVEDVAETEVEEEEEQEPVVELYTDFGSVAAEESSIPEEVTVEEAPEVPDVVDEVAEDVIEEVEEEVEEEIEEWVAEEVQEEIGEESEEWVAEEVGEEVEEEVEEEAEEWVAEEDYEEAEEAAEEFEDAEEEHVVTPEEYEDIEKIEAPEIDMAKSEDLQEGIVESSSEEATEPLSEEETTMSNLIHPAQPEVEKKPLSPESEKSTEPLTEYSEEKTFTLSGNNVAIYDDVQAY